MYLYSECVYKRASVHDSKAVHGRFIVGIHWMIDIRRCEKLRKTITENHIQMKTEDEQKRVACRLALEYTTLFSVCRDGEYDAFVCAMSTRICVRKMRKAFDYKR